MFEHRKNDYLRYWKSSRDLPKVSTMGCPLCGKFTHNAKTRLIRDTCGHLKCRLCLLKEENGCRVCEAQLRIDSIGRFDYPLPASKSPNYEFPNCEPHNLTINKIPVNVEINDLSQSTEKEIMVNKSNLQNQDNEVQTETNENIQQSEVNNTTDNQNIDEQNASTFQKVILVRNSSSDYSNDSHLVNNDRVLVVTEEREKIIEDVQHKNLNDQTNLKNNTNGINENQIVYQINTPVSSRSTENSSQLVNSGVESSDSSDGGIPILQQSHAVIENSSKLTELEKLLLPNKTPNHLSYTNQESRLNDSVGSPFKSPAFRMSDYLTFNKQFGKGDGTPLPVNYKTPDFRLSDYILLKDKFNQDEVTQNIDKHINERERKSGDYITSDGFLVERVSEDDESSMIDIEDDFSLNYFNETDTATDNSSSTISHPILMKKCMSNNTINCNPKQSQNTKCDFKGTNSSSSKRARSKNSKAEDDEDKENKKRKKEKATKKSTKTKSDTRTAALKKANHPSKSKIKVVNSLKTKSNKRKKKEETNKLSDEPVATRRGERKRKRKVLLYENEVLEMSKEKRNYRSSPLKWDVSRKRKKSPKRRGRKPKADWTHVVRLPGTPASYRCNVCDANFTHWRGRSEHAACRVGLPPYHCNTCNRSFYKRTHYEYHERSHTGEKPYTCRLCSKGFVQKNKLNRHLSVHQQQNRVECDICKKKYRTKEYLKNHLITHKENVFKCSQCPKSFGLAANRKRHELSHSTERPFACDICSKSFKSKFLMTRHKRLHEKSRPFNCEQCKHSFLLKSELRRHMLCHTDSKPYVCEVCKAEFRRQDNLKRHVLHHHTQDVPADVVVGDSAGNEDDRLLISGPSSPEVSMKKKPSKIQMNKTEEVNEVDKVKNSKKPRKVQMNKNEAVNEADKVKNTKKSRKVQMNKTEAVNETDKVKNTKKPRKVQMNKTEAVNEADKVKNTKKLKKVSRKNSTASNKSSPKTSPISSKTNVSSTAVPISIEPTSSKFFFADDIPREEALLINQQIDLKMQAQNSFCIYPGLSKEIDLCNRKESSKCNSILNAATTAKQSTETEKSKNASDEDSNQKNKPYVHWRRRTAESLRSIVKNKSQKDIQR